MESTKKYTIELLEDNFHDLVELKVCNLFTIKILNGCSR